MVENEENVRLRRSGPQAETARTETVSARQTVCSRATNGQVAGASDAFASTPLPAPLSLDLRGRILDAALRSGAPQTEVARRFAVHVATVERLLRRHRETGSVAPVEYRRGPAPALSEADDARIEGYLDDDNDATLVEMAARFEAETGRRISDMAVVRSLRRRGVSRKKRRSGRPSA
jgi:putative transposase